ncbi:MAG: hypothetical protein WCO94_03205 [Verrucomicrobiota bacterium]
MQHRRLCVSVWTLGVTGPRCAAALQRMIAKNRPEIVVSSGFSGALQAGLELGTVVIGENFSDPQLVRRVKSVGDHLSGPISTVPEVLETSDAKMRHGLSSGALVGDLESLHLYEVCRQAGIPMLSVRTVSDTIEQDMPIPADVLINPETGKTDPSAIFQYLFRHPTKAAEFAKLVRGARCAQQSLAAALEAILPAVLRQK